MDVEREDGRAAASYNGDASPGLRIADILADATYTGTNAVDRDSIRLFHPQRAVRTRWFLSLPLMPALCTFQTTHSSLMPTLSTY